MTSLARQIDRLIAHYSGAEEMVEYVRQREINKQNDNDSDSKQTSTIAIPDIIVKQVYNLKEINLDEMLLILSKGLNEEEFEMFVNHFELRHERAITRRDAEIFNRGVPINNKLRRYRYDVLQAALQVIIDEGNRAFCGLRKK